MIKNRYLRTVAFATVVQFVILFGLRVTAHAQTASPNPSPGDTSSGSGELQQVTVTGYLLPNVGDGREPVTTYDQTFLSKMGNQNIAEVVQQLPAATGNVNPGVVPGFGFQPAAASIALKGLLPSDTLVLVDGLRMPVFPFFQFGTETGPFPFARLNSIPLGAIDRVDILNDGGSATYGTDAVAGVVNFITKDQYQGADIYNYFGISQRGDYEVYHGEFTGGIVQKLGQDSKISILAVFDYYDQSPVEAIDRSNEALNYSRLSFKYPNAPVFPRLTGQFTVLNTFIVVPQGPGGTAPGPVNPFNSFPEPLQVGPQAFNEFGVLKTDVTVTTFREVIGGTIQLPHGWYIDSNWLYGESDGTETMSNFFRFTGLQQALNGTRPGNPGQCFNPFADESVAGPNKAFYGNKQLIGNIWEDIRTDIMQFHTVAGGTLFELPSGAITTAGGFEYRSEAYIANDDPYTHSSNVTAPQFPVGNLINARRYIWSIFGEVDIPIIGGAWSWPGLRSIEF